MPSSTCADARQSCESICLTSTYQKLKKTQQTLVYIHVTLFTYTPEYIWHMSQNNELQSSISCYSHTYASNKHAPQMAHMPLLHVWTWDNYISKYTSYELTTMDNVTASTGKHALHIAGICP